MKLSQIRGERVLDVIAQIIEPAANIAEDEAAAALFKREKLPEGMTVRDFIFKRARKSIPALLKDHKADIITLLAVIEGVSPEEYTGALNLPKLLKDLIELMTDDAFSSLFISAQTGSSSGSAQENTGDTKA